MSAKRSYETTVIINAGLEDTAVDTLVSNIDEYMKNNGGEIQTMEKWGRKRLAYPIQKKNNGYYVYYLYEAPATLPPLLERYFHLEENIIRHLTVILDGKMLDFRKKTMAEKALSEEKPSGNERSGSERPRRENSERLEKEISVKVGAEAESGS